MLRELRGVGTGAILTGCVMCAACSAESHPRADSGVVSDAGDASSAADGGADAGAGPPRELGEPCDAHEQCASNNCDMSAVPPRCAVPLGSECDSGNCELCLVSDGGVNSFCSRTCSFSMRCDEETRCTGSEGTGFRCNATCETDADCGWLAPCIPVLDDEHATVLGHVCRGPSMP